MKKIVYLFLLVGLIGCQSEEEKIKEKQIFVCKEQIQSGQEPTPFCLNLLPEYRKVVSQNVPQNGLQQSGEYVPEVAQQPYVEQIAPNGGQPVQQVVQQPQYVPVPVQSAPVVQNGSSTADTIRDMAIGGMIGSSISNNSNNNRSNYNDSYRDTYRQPTYRQNITKNVTIVNKPVAPVAPIVPKKNYMDTSKLSSYGARPSPRPFTRSGGTSARLRR
jgi:hypothetical protein